MTPETLAEKGLEEIKQKESGQTLEQLAQKVEEKRIAAENAKTELSTGWTKEKEEEFRKLSDEWKGALERYNETRAKLNN